MARLFPNQPQEGTERSEKDVLSALKHATRDWIVIHGKRFVIRRPGRRRAIEGEADFLVLDPSRGAFLCIEVKGGQELGRDAHGWYTVPHGSDSRRRIKDPGEQAQNAAHQLGNELRTRVELHRLGFAWGVAFPGLEMGSESTLELPRERALDRADLNEIDRSIQRIFDTAGVDGPPIDRDGQQAFLDTLMPAFRLVPSVSPIEPPPQKLGVVLEQQYGDLVRLTEEQYEILDTLAEFTRIAVDGPAGSGKTMVAMERARRLAAEGKRVLFLCYNRLLADHLADHADGFAVRSFHRLCIDLTKAAGIPQPAKLRSPDGPPQDFWGEEAPESLMEALDFLPEERWDAVIVDEGQDFKELWWLAVEKLLRNEAEDILWVFFDARQNLFGGGPAENLGLQLAHLTHNCRNTTKIAHYAYGFVGAEPKLRAAAPPGVEVTELVCDSPKDMVDGVRKALHEIIVNQEVPSERVVVLSRKSTGSSSVWEAGIFGNLRLVEYPAAPGPNEVQFCSVGRFKGLEADVIILCEVDLGAESAWESDELRYVATSRARQALWVLSRSAR